MKVVWTKIGLKTASKLLTPDMLEKLKTRLQGIETSGFEGYDVKHIEGRRVREIRIRLGSLRVFAEWQGAELFIVRVTDRKDAY